VLCCATSRTTWHVGDGVLDLEEWRALARDVHVVTARAPPVSLGFAPRSVCWLAGAGRLRMSWGVARTLTRLAGMDSAEDDRSRLGEERDQPLEETNSFCSDAAGQTAINVRPEVAKSFPRGVILDPRRPHRNF